MSNVSEKVSPNLVLMAMDADESLLMAGKYNDVQFRVTVNVVVMVCLAVNTHPTRKYRSLVGMVFYHI